MTDGRAGPSERVRVKSDRCTSKQVEKKVRIFEEAATHPSEGQGSRS